MLLRNRDHRFRGHEREGLLRFQTSAKILNKPLDSAALGSVLFLLLIFILLSSQYVFVPGVEVRLPETKELQVTTPSGPSIAVAIDRGGRFFYDNATVTSSTLRERLMVAVRQAQSPLTLVLMADREASYEKVLEAASIARLAGISRTIMATRQQGLFQGSPVKK